MTQTQQHVEKWWINRRWLTHRVMMSSWVIMTVLGTSPIGAGAEIDKPQIKRVVLVVLENQDQDVVMKNEYFAELARKGTVFSDSNAVRHPSYPNYVALVAGDPHGIWSDEQIIIRKRSLADLLEAKGLTWKNYVEGYPGGADNCFLGDDNQSSGYVRRHVPFLSFESIQKSKSRCANIVDGGMFEQDRQSNQLPTLAFYSPNLCHSGHGGRPFCDFGSSAKAEVRLTAAGQWLKGILTPMLSDGSFMRDTLIVITFDEAGNYSPVMNKVYTVFLGDVVQVGSEYKDRIDHYSVLRTVEYLFHLGTLGENDDHRDPITSVWR